MALLHITKFQVSYEVSREREFKANPVFSNPSSFESIYNK